MTGRISPNQGSVTLFGVNPIKDYKKIAHRISVVGEEKCLYDDITVAKNLEFFSKLYDCNPKAINEAVKFFELEEVLDKKVSKLSTGYKQRVVLARAIIHDPDIIFLDEPSLGLDPHIARKIRDKIKELNKMGKTIFLTTHYLDEAEYLCDRIVVLKNGNISQPIEINQLKESYGSLANYYMKVYED